MPGSRIVWGKIKYRYTGLLKKEKIAAASKANLEIDMPNLPCKRQRVNDKAGGTMEIELPTTNTM